MGFHSTFKFTLTFFSFILPSEQNHMFTVQTVTETVIDPTITWFDQTL